MMTGSCGYRVLARCNSPSPDSPGMRMSETSTFGGSGAVSRAVSASLADAKLRYEMFSRLRAFSITQRMERSSSTIQTVFISYALFWCDRA